MTTNGERIRYIRKSKGLTQKALGELCGIAEPTIRRYELGKLNPKYETLQKIAKAMDVPISELLGSPELGNGGELAPPFEQNPHLHNSKANSLLSKIGAVFGQNRSDSYIEKMNLSLRESDSLNSDLYKITKYFQELNHHGREKVIEYALDLAMLPQYERIDESKMMLWPHNVNSKKIDKEYYSSLPVIPKELGMKEYIKCYPIGGDSEKFNPYQIIDSKHGLVEFYTEKFDSETEEDHFIGAALKKYFISLSHKHFDDEGGYFFSAYAFGYIIRDKFDEKNCYWLLENWAE